MYFDYGFIIKLIEFNIISTHIFIYIILYCFKRLNSDYVHRRIHSLWLGGGAEGWGAGAEY